MGGLNPFKAPSVPTPPPVPVDTIAIADEASAERRRRQSALGRQSTILNSNATTDAGTQTQRSTLLGG